MDLETWTWNLVETMIIHFIDNLITNTIGNEIFSFSKNPN